MGEVLALEMHEAQPQGEHQAEHGRIELAFDGETAVTWLLRA
jgi:hypothetical protein